MKRRVLAGFLICFFFARPVSATDPPLSPYETLIPGAGNTPSPYPPDLVWSDPGGYSWGLFPPSDTSATDPPFYPTPWGKQRRRFRLECWNYLSQPVAETPTIVSVVRQANSYGHHHPGTSNSNCVGGFSLYATGAKYVDYLYETPEASGIVDVTLACSTGDPFTFTIGTGVRGLYQTLVQGVDSYVLTGERPSHPSDNHYGIPLMNTRLYRLAEAFFAETGVPLPINDMSLRFGGMFDASRHDWAPGKHTWHRLGTDVDINLHTDRGDLQRDARRILLQTLGNKGLQFYVKEDVSNHVHLLLVK